MDEIVLSRQIIRIDPCTASKGMVSGEIRPGCEFDVCRVRGVLERSHEFTDVKCSTALNAVKAKYGKKSITIFSNGRISIFRAADEKDIMGTAEAVLVAIKACAKRPYEVKK